MLEVIKEIKPTETERKKLLALVDSIIKRIKIRDTKVVLGGSGAKDTFLRGTHDIDIYVKFNYKKYKDKSDKISEVLFSALKRNFKVSRLHGSRDYFQIKKSGFTFEVVPILDIKNYKQAKNITDISSLHVGYVKKHKNLADQIRLTKAFMKANNVYGAESYISGFSGYVAELLTIYYKSFNSLIKNAAWWKDKTLIGNKELIKKLNKSKKVSPLILLDPVQKDRNAAAALSKEKYLEFIKAARSYIKSPSKKFFKEQPLRLENYTVIEVEPLRGKKDIIGAKLIKILDYIKSSLTREGFKVKESKLHWNKEALLLLKISPKKLPKIKIRYGPPVKIKSAVINFKKKYPNAKIKKGRLYINIKREYYKLEDFLKNLLKDEYIKEKTNTIKLK